MKHELISHSIDDLDTLAAALLQRCEAKRIIAVYGPMGAGKTTFIKRLCKVLGVVDSVSSPTFALVNEYKIPGQKPVFHFDFYRIHHLEEAMDIGPEEYFDSGSYCLIEWPELVEPLLPSSCIRIRIAVRGAQRVFSIEESTTSRN